MNFIFLIAPLFFLLACEPEAKDTSAPVVPRPDPVTDQGPVCPLEKPNSDTEKSIPVDRVRLAEQMSAQAGSADKNLREHARHAKNMLAKYPPVVGIRINEAEYYLSERLCVPKIERPFALLYSVVKNVIRVFPMYRSLSNGIWRSTIGSDSGRYVKGIHYTQDFLPHQSLTEILDSGELGKCKIIPSDIIVNQFDQAKRPKTDASKAVSVPTSADFNKYINGQGLNNSGDKAAFLASMTKENLPKDFYPEFTCLHRTYKSSHSLLSEHAVDAEHVVREKTLSVDVFLARLNNRTIEWHFVYEHGTKEPWIARIRFAENEYSDLGNDAVVIMSGALTLKPFEYRHQVRNLVEGEDYRPTDHASYFDLRQFIQKFPPVIDYKKYKDNANSW